MTYKFGDVIYDPSDKRCGQMLGKLVIASNIAVDIIHAPSACTIGALSIVSFTPTDRPFVLNVSGLPCEFTFIREIIET